VQDILGLGSEARMNTPGKASGSWAWRLTDREALGTALKHLHSLTQETSRGLSATQVSLQLR
jgi:4-alpha-glucanotransferase